MNMRDLPKTDAMELTSARGPLLETPDFAGDTQDLDRLIETACNRIAPVWPLDRFVAVNPFHGLRDKSFREAADLLACVADARLYMPRAYYREQVAAGRITDADLAQAVARCGEGLDVATLRAALRDDSGPASAAVPLLTAVLDEQEADDWSSFVVERIGHHCAAYFDMGQATWKKPWQGRSLYAAWRSFAALDYSATMMGEPGIRARVKALPESPWDTIRAAIGRLGIPEAGALDYMHAALLDIGGWAAWTRLIRWEQELQGGSDDTIVELLAIRLAWDVLVYEHKVTPQLRARWRAVCEALGRGEHAAPAARHQIDHLLLTALELGYQRELAAKLVKGSTTGGRPAKRPVVQAAFCIDVRSEVMRRALETVCPRAQTLGFAGFFGVPIEHVPFGMTEARAHLPVLLTPSYRVCTEVRGADATEAAAAREQQRSRLGMAKAWKAFKMGASSCFSFVEAAGIFLYAPKLLADSLGMGRPVPAPDDLHLDPTLERRAAPTLEPSAQAPCAEHAHGHHHGTQTAGRPLGIPAEERVGLAEGILRAMSLTDGFARLVLLVGHGSTTVNNPHASGLDCGACAGQTGEASARIAAALMNDEAVRQGLAERGIRIPLDTHFLAAQHDTCTDDIRLFDADRLPESYAEELAELRSWLKHAGELTRLQRAALLGIDAGSHSAVQAAVRRRSRDWSQVRPEWGLTGCAAFIAAPRARTRGLDLGGRTFLHDYEWRQDEGFGVLELIMTAPMIVAGWINLQYYGSTTDNRRFGSGNKVLHNVVGGALGVLEGNAGDLRVGLPMQSLHDGKRWMHEPMRLSVVLEAPREPIDAIIERHELVRQMLDNGWLHLFRLDDAGLEQRLPERGWGTPAYDAA
ncbi:YbcC family protein [Thiorhodococcus minor]|uniref:Probable inorganic carbon transporter subunit DabA n=1 Tax=Thiorhodococcus minor TaxID=57489 RepID=A0A6M0JZA0_9GAMM|nr:DUF2309 domain-containing protein [Thiorhodococcus minor]NEV62489.1 DUF2309 domain-containing protein [Thiorhodococcus minor]